MNARAHSRLNNSGDIALVTNGEAQHVSRLQKFVTAVGNQYNAMTRTTTTLQDSETLRSTYMQYRDQEETAVMLDQEAMDNQTTGAHAMLGREIKARGGWTP